MKKSFPVHNHHHCAATRRNSSAVLRRSAWSPGTFHYMVSTDAARFAINVVRPFFLLWVTK